MELKDLVANSDGSFTVQADGKSIRLVKESDLLAIKGASENVKVDYEAKISKHLTDLAESKRLLDEKHNLLLQEQAAKEAVMKDAQEAATLKAKVGEYEAKLNEAMTGRTETEKHLLDMLKERFTTTYKVPADKVKDMNLAQLRDAEKVLALTGIGTRSANYDGGAAAVGSGERTPEQRLAERYPTMKVV